MNKKRQFNLIQVVGILCVISSFNSFAQIQKGALLLGAGVDLNGSSHDEYYYFMNPDGSVTPRSYKVRTPSGSFSARYGIFSSESVFWGIDAGFDFEAAKVNGSVARTTGASLSPVFIKYKQLHERWYLSLGFSPYIGFTRSGQAGVSGKGTTVRYAFDVTPGLNYFITDRWMISSALGMLHYGKEIVTHVPQPSQPKFNRYTYDFSLVALSFSLNVQYLINNNKK